MSVWDNYQTRKSVSGITKRDSVLRREIRTLNNKLPDSLSYHTVSIFPAEDGYDLDRFDDISRFAQNVAIINTDNLNEKFIYSLPGDDIEHGSLVYWMDNYWLVVERDANTTVYTKAKLLQCNHLLKWVGDDHIVHEQWSVVEDGTKLRVLSFRVEKSACIKYLSNCWNPLKPALLQRKDERCLCVIVAKAERKCRIA